LNLRPLDLRRVGLTPPESWMVLDEVCVDLRGYGRLDHLVRQRIDAICSTLTASLAFSGHKRGKTQVQCCPRDRTCGAQRASPQDPNPRPQSPPLPRIIGGLMLDPPRIEDGAAVQDDAPQRLAMHFRGAGAECAVSTRQRAAASVRRWLSDDRHRTGLEGWRVRIAHADRRVPHEDRLAKRCWLSCALSQHRLRPVN
jgi:hypothetical protein